MIVALFYINVAFFVLALALMLLWARMAIWISADLAGLTDQPVMVWKSALLGSLLLMTIVWLIIPSFYIAFPLNILIAGGIFGWYWKIRTAQLGSSGGGFFGALTGKFGQMAQGHQAQKSAQQLILAYMKASGNPAVLPRTDDPSWASMIAADQLLIQAMDGHAQKIELIPSQQAYDVHFTVDGVGYPQSGVQRNTAEMVIQAVKTLSGLSLEERRRPQSGAFMARDPDRNTVTWTAHTSGTTAGEKLVIQANEKDSWRLPMDHLGFSSDQLTAIKEVMKQPDGLVIVAAPPHMGRTTTLYSFLAGHDAFTTSIQTLEINPRVEFESITITRFDPQATDASHSKTLQSLMLKDPHVLMVAQCPDAVTAELAAKYASVEHQVYLGLKAPDTRSVLDLWRKLVADREIAAKSLRAIVAQRLVRLLCPTCKVAYQPDSATIAKLNLPVGRELQSFKANTQTVRDQRGNLIKCPDCGGMGYRGQTGIFEVLVVNNDIRKAIMEGKNIEEITTLARKAGMVMLVEHGIRKFAMGITSIQEVIRVCSAEKAPVSRSRSPGSPGGSRPGSSSAGGTASGRSQSGTSRSGSTASGKTASGAEDSGPISLS